jgi:NAD(P)H-dependent flavin oxidoreductase YrpB (nitropropane dioxygenase family)
MSAIALEHPLIIQGGMGVGVSNWTLARAVSLRGQLGVVSGTGIDALFVRGSRTATWAATSAGPWTRSPSRRS